MDNYQHISRVVVSERIDAIKEHLVSEGLDDQFHPSYTLPNLIEIAEGIPLSI